MQEEIQHKERYFEDDYKTLTQPKCTFTGETYQEMTMVSNYSFR